jgi:hypothetical protein
MMEEFAYMAAPYMILRSGSAPGADSAFEMGCKNRSGECEIFLPWKNFNSSDSPLYQVADKALEIAASIHPHFKYMKRPAKMLIARNMHQILGQDLNTPVEFVVCWTKDGCESHETYNPSSTGGTGSAIALASKLGIPVYNLFNDRLIAAHEHLMQYKRVS